MNESALEGFVRIVELNSFPLRRMHCIFRSLRFPSRSARWKGSCSLNCSGMCRAGCC